MESLRNANSSQNPISIVRVSLAPDGTQANNSSSNPSLSADGRYVAFESDASNLVPGDTNKFKDIFVRDLQTGQTTRVNVASDGTQTNGWSYNPSLSADGRYVAFDSDASNLVAGDTNNSRDVFVRDLQTGQTTRVSVASDGTPRNFYSAIQSFSVDGRYVVFASSSYLVPGDTDIFVHDRQTGQTTPLETAPNFTLVPKYGGFSISNDGRHLAFSSNNEFLIPGDTNEVADLFVRDLTLPLPDLIEPIIGTDGNDDLLGSDEPKVFMGGLGSDRILSGAGNDRIYGNSGDDLLDGGAGEDLLFGGKDRDVIFGNEGADSISGDSEDDLIYGGEGNDVIESSSGSDTVFGNSGDDRFFSNEDSFFGKSSLLYGNSGNDTIDGGTGHDTLYGGQGDDLVMGGAYLDFLFGDAGNDTLVGNNRTYALEASPNTLTGGGGADVFVIAELYSFSDLPTPIFSNNNIYMETIADLDPTQDSILLDKYKTYHLEERAIAVEGTLGRFDTYIYEKIPAFPDFPARDKLVAIVQGVSGLSLDSSVFTFYPDL